MIIILYTAKLCFLRFHAPMLLEGYTEFQSISIRKHAAVGTQLIGKQRVG